MLKRNLSSIYEDESSWNAFIDRPAELTSIWHASTLKYPNQTLFEWIEFNQTGHLIAGILLTGPDRCGEANVSVCPVQFFLGPFHSVDRTQSEGTQSNFTHSSETRVWTFDKAGLFSEWGKFKHLGTFNT